MDRLETLRVFVAVAESRSFTTAADKLRLSRAVVSKAIHDLEAELGARLLERTTRRVKLNEVGAAYFDKCVRILADLDEADSAVRELHDVPRGTLRLTAPLSFAVLHLKPVITQYLAAHPDVNLAITLEDRFADLVDEGLDLAIRITRPEESSLVARRIAPARRVMCAAPAYLAAHPAPRQPADLAQHRCLIYGGHARAETWALQGPGGEQAVQVSGPLASNNGDLLHCAAVGGLGIALLPTFIVGPSVQSGELQVVLPDYRPEELAVYAVYPPNRHLAAKVRTFIDLLAGHFGRKPYWDLVG